MTAIAPYQSEQPDLSSIEAKPGMVVLDFGANWCSVCQGAAPDIAAAMSQKLEVAHVKIEDGQGRRLGRSFKVKLWPTLIMMRDGKEVARVVRPESAQDVQKALAAFD